MARFECRPRISYIAIQFAPTFQPQTQHPGGLIEVPRRWLRVQRYCAFGELKWHVATCRQTVEALIRAAVHRLAADGYMWHVATCRQTVEA